MSLRENKGGIEIFLLIGVVAISVFVAGGLFTQSADLSLSNNQPVNVSLNSAGNPNATSSGSQELQLQTFNGVPITPPPGPVAQTPSTPNTPTASTPGISNPTVACGQVDAGPNGTYITGDCGGCIEDGPESGGESCCAGVPTVSNWTLNPQYANTPWCDAKPVIYLYPEEKTDVSVKVTIPGVITRSIPLYKNGWSVVAYPDGTLISNGAKYSELFYETEQSQSEAPTNGWIVEKSQLRIKLMEITTNLGLNSKEQQEFLNYWLPRLNGLDKPYYFVSFFSNKDAVDKVTITPKPDNFIQFIMYFKGLDKETTVNSPTYPIVPPRVGFTAVEWGGILDH